MFGEVRVFATVSIKAVITLMSATPCRRRPLSCGTGCDEDGEEMVSVYFSPDISTFLFTKKLCDVSNYFYLMK
jgi:hypothetical protein